MGMKNLVVLSTGLLDGLSHITSLSESLNFCHIQLKEYVWKHHPKCLPWASRSGFREKFGQEFFFLLCLCCFSCLSWKTQYSIS